jgi:CspA family cold shock protein
LPYITAIEFWPIGFASCVRIDHGPARRFLRDIDDRRAATTRRLERARQAQQGQTMKSGTVKWFNAQKGYGFIAQDETGPDVFVHISAVERAGMNDLREGQKLVFDIVADKRTGKSSAGNLRAA